MELVLFWFMFSIVVGVFAGTKNRTGFGWFILSLIISPIITFLLVAVLPRVSKNLDSLEAKLLEAKRLKDSGMITEEEYQSKRKAILESN
jgi:hypothetical protein